MDTYYDITLTTAIPQGSDILNKACTVVFTYADGSHSDIPYTGTIFSWPTANTVRIKSRIMNIEAGWNGASGGTLTIATTVPLARNISAFAKA